MLLKFDLEFLELSPKTLTNSLQATSRDFDTLSYLTLTVFLCIMLILLSIFGISILLSEKNLSDLVHTDIQKDKMWESPKSLWCLLGGILIILCGSFLAVFYNGNIGEILQIYLLLVGSGLFMALVFGTGYLNTIQKRKREYDRILLKWERFYHKINKNNCMILIQTMIGFVVIILAFHVNCAVIGRQERQTKYPADFLCTYDSNSDFLMRFKEKYGEDCKEFQFVRIASGKTAPLLGISVEQYNKMFKKNEILNENEAIAIFHENAVVGTLIENQKNKESADIFFGKSSEIDWLAKEDARYVMKKEEVGDIFGFALDVDGVVILSNQDFQKARVKDGAYESIALLNVKSKERVSATKFLKEQNLTGMLSKEIEREKEVKDQLLEILILSVLGGLTWFFSLFIMWLKIFSEMDNLKKKYDFLYVLGMKPREQREVLKYESVIPIKIQIVVTVVLALLFGVTQIFRLTGKESVIGWTGFIFALMMYLTVEFLFLKFIQRWVHIRLSLENATL